MNEFEKQIILKAFLKCFGLRSSLQKNDDILRKSSIESLANQTGMRISFIEITRAQ